MQIAFSPHDDRSVKSVRALDGSPALARIPEQIHKDCEKGFAVGFRETPVAFCEVGGDRKRQLVGERVTAARESFRACGDLIGEVHSLRVDLKVLKHEGHFAGPEFEQKNT